MKLPTAYLAASVLMTTMLGVTCFGAPTMVHPSEEQGSGPGYTKIQTLDAAAEAALKADDVKAAVRYASQLLAANTDTTSWNYGNVVYDANQILGLAALKQDNVAAADQYLLAAGRTPGSPQLNSFGPDMTLANALLAKGQGIQVSKFLNSVAKFWATPAPGMQQFAQLYQQHAATIKRWQEEIASGKSPNLNRFDFGTSQPTVPPLLLAVGTPAPDFTAQDKDGKPVKLSDYKGKVVVLDFWSTWCGPCQKSLPHTNAVARQFAGQAVVLAVNVWDSTDAFNKWLPQHPEYDAVQFAIDPKTTLIPNSYHVSGIPTQYVINAQGSIVKAIVGYGGPTSDLADAITQAGKS